MKAYNGEQPAGQRHSLEAERQFVIDRLTDAFAADTITMDEYERCASAVSAANNIDELERIAFDVPITTERPVNPQRRAVSSGRAIDNSIVGAVPVMTACIMSDRTMTGNWLSSDRVSSFTVMGSTKLDLRDVDLPTGPIRIEVFTLMGDTKIIVPVDLPVHLNVFAFMGDSKAGREVRQKTGGARSWVEISGFVMMGSLAVRASD
ncbi:MAG TPA: LiaF domain-containing protein [bacterium]|nr:LiaF domain-containing protein [bacterium]